MRKKTAHVPMVSPSSAHRASGGGGEENKIQSNVTRARENGAPDFFGLISGCAAAKVDAGQQPGRRLAAGIGSPVCTAPTSALLAPLVHTGGRAAPSQALSLRTRNPFSQSGVTQEDRSCWWVGRSAATKRGRRPVLPQSDRPGAQF